MTLPLPLQLMGAPGSPYTRKILGLLRYRRIAHEFMLMGTEDVKDLPVARPPLAPTFFLPNDTGQLTALTDSTPLIRRFEKEWTERSVIPTRSRPDLPRCTDRGLR